MKLSLALVVLVALASAIEAKKQKIPKGSKVCKYQLPTGCPKGTQSYETLVDTGVCPTPDEIAASFMNGGSSRSSEESGSGFSCKAGNGSSESGSSGSASSGSGSIEVDATTPEPGLFTACEYCINKRSKAVTALAECELSCNPDESVSCAC